MPPFEIIFDRHAVKVGLLDMKNEADGVAKWRQATPWASIYQPHLVYLPFGLGTSDGIFVELT